MKALKKYFIKLLNTPFPEEYSREGVLQYIVDTEVVELFIPGYLKENMNTYKALEYYQEIWLLICSLSDEKLRDLHSQGPVSLRAFIVTLVKQNCISKNSRAYYHVVVPNKKTFHFTDWDGLTEDEVPFLDTVRNNDLNDLSYECNK